MSKLAQRLRDGTAMHDERIEAADALDAQEARIQSLERRLHEITEEWAGAECGEPITAQEGYAIQLCKRMYGIAVDAIAAKGEA